MNLLLLLLLNRFSRVQLCATPQTAAHQAPPSLGFSNSGVGCHCLLQCMKVKSENEVAQSCPTLSDPMDYSPPGSSIHGIFQARVLEWGAMHRQQCNEPAPPSSRLAPAQSSLSPAKSHAGTQPYRKPFRNLALQKAMKEPRNSPASQEHNKTFNKEKIKRRNKQS